MAIVDVWLLVLVWVSRFPSIKFRFFYFSF